MNKKTSLLAQANSLLRKDKYAEAIGLYQELGSQGLLPSAIVEFNIDFARGKMAAQAAARARPAQPQRKPSSKAPTNAFSFADRSCAAHLKREPLPSAATQPKVSVVLTCFNAQDTIEESVESILNQNYRNIEVIVCDDASTDRSWQILCDMQRRCPGLKAIRNNANYGTYLSKNRAIDRASGKIILFQDADDISHPRRVSIQVAPLLSDDSLIATRTKYLRYNEATEEIVPVSKLASKYGLITLAVWKRAFLEIGFFDAVRRAGDDEWVQRLTHLYGQKALRDIDVTLYLARLRPDSLAADILTFNADGSSVEQSPSAPRKAYVEQFRSRFAAHREKDHFRRNFPAFPLRANAPYPESVEALAPVRERVYASLCSIPSRLDSLRSTIRSLEHQVDGLFVYLDKYDEVPADLGGHPKVTMLRSQDFDADHRDNAKFVAYNSLVVGNSPFYYFTCDDDIEYPHDYVSTMIQTLRGFDNRVVLGVHGVIVEERARSYFRRRFIFHFAKHSVDAFRLVNNLGTGTVGFHSTLFPSIDPRQWPRGGMVDIYFSVECKKNMIPMVCIDRHSGWLVDLDKSKSTPTLFNEFSDKEELITNELQAAMPWGLAGIDQVLRAQEPTLRERLVKGLPRFHRAVSVSACLHRYRA